jgi:hypothetical protein
MTDISKRVLLIAPRVFGYDEDIRREIEQRGYAVDLLPDRPFRSSLMVATAKLRPELTLIYTDYLYKRLLESFGAPHYETILVVNAQTVSSNVLRLLRASYPRARFVLYMWDSIENRPMVLSKLGQFDRAYSFDPESARKYGMVLRPLFFSKSFEEMPTADIDFDLSFVGTIHTDRYAVIDRLRRQLPHGARTYWYMYLQARWVYYWFRAVKPSMSRTTSSEFHFVPLSREGLRLTFARSRAVLDIEHPLQRGLTMRTLEALGARRKLVTTNAQIRDYDFFSSTNVCVIDRERPLVPSEFFESAFEDIPLDMYRRYTLAGWVDEVLAL